VGEEPARGALDHPGLLFGGELPGGESGADDPADERPAGLQRASAGHIAGQGVADDHAGAVPVEALPAGETAVGEGACGGFQGEPVGRVGGAVGGLGHPEGRTVEAPALEHSRPDRGPGVLAGVQPDRGQAPESAPATEEQFEELR
jgi:hypothetical protein